MNGLDEMAQTEKDSSKKEQGGLKEMAQTDKDIRKRERQGLGEMHKSYLMRGFREIIGVHRMMIENNVKGIKEKAWDIGCTIKKICSWK